MLAKEDRSAKCMRDQGILVNAHNWQDGARRATEEIAHNPMSNHKVSQLTAQRGGGVMPISAGGMDDEAMPIEEVVEDDFQTGSDVIGLEEVSAKATHVAEALDGAVGLHRPSAPALQQRGAHDLTTCRTPRGANIAWRHAVA
jgi:hypothetical protein